MADLSEEFYLYIVFAFAAIFMLTFFIPYYGFLRKSWKGLGIGCLLQPVIAIAGIALVMLFAGLYSKHMDKKSQTDAMVTVLDAFILDSDSVRHTWYLKPDEECYHKHRFSDVDEDGDTSVHTVSNYYDIVRIDSTTVGVEDRIVVHFDLKNHTAIATTVDVDDTLEIIQIDWPKVESYLQNKQ